MNLSAKSWKKWLNSRKRTKPWFFLQFFEQTTISWHFHELFTKKLQKVPHFVKKHGKSSISPKLGTFRKNYHVFTFRWTLWQKLAKTASFREKEREFIDFAKAMQLFRTNYHVLVFQWTFEQKVAKSCSIRGEARKIIDLAKIFQLFEQTTMSLHFDELFRKKLQKVPHFAKKHEKSSIWPKLTTTRTKYHVSAFWSAFQQKVVKSIVGAYQAQAIITGFATSICSFHLCRDWGNDFWNYVSRSTGVLG